MSEPARHTAVVFGRPQSRELRLEATSKLQIWNVPTRAATTSAIY